MNRETLEDRLAAARLRLAALESAKARKARGEACPSLADHETETLIVSTGEMPNRTRWGLGITVRFRGYQIQHCLACGVDILARYEGERVAVISHKTASSLAHGRVKALTQDVA